MPMKVAQCLNCGQVKTIYAKGLCKRCYERIRSRNRRGGLHPRIKKVSQCLDCGLLRTVNSKGLCLQCYKKRWIQKKRGCKLPSNIPRVCVCGCGRIITKPKGNQKYFDLQDRLEAERKRVTSVCLGVFECPVCREFGTVIVRYYRNTLGSFIIQHHVKGKRPLQTRCYWNPY